MEFGLCVAKRNTDGYEDNEGTSDDSEIQAEAVGSFFFTQGFI